MMSVFIKGPSKGVALSSLLIGLLLSSVIVTALIQHYLSIKQHYQTIQMALEDSMALQSVVDLVRDSVRKAGFTPCLGLDYLESIDQRSGRTGLTAITVSTTPEVSFRANRMNESFDVVTRFLGSNRLVASRSQRLIVGHPILISDCYHAEVHDVMAVWTDSNDQVITFSKPLAFAYEPPIYVGEWVQERFFIHSSASSHALPTLYYQANHTEELTTLVHRMTVLKQRRREHDYVTVTLGLDAERSMGVDVMVRG